MANGISTAYRHLEICELQLSALDIRVHLSPQEVLCIVADDGVGFDADAARGAPGHTGLLSMQERAKKLGGVFTLVSRPGAGARILVAIPRQT